MTNTTTWAETAKKLKEECGWTVEFKPLVAAVNDAALERYGGNTVTDAICGWVFDNIGPDYYLRRVEGEGAVFTLELGPPYLWRSPGGISGDGFRSRHPDAPPHAVMQEACRLGHVDFTLLGAT